MKHDTTPIHLGRTAELNAAASPACVIIIYGGDLGRRVALTNDITIGRDDDNAISLALHSISRRHARLFRRDGVHYVEDLGSTNGTSVNDHEISTPAALRNGDLIRCGAAVLKFIEGGNVEALYHEEIYRLTITDGLTQVANRRHFTDFLEREIARATRHDRPLSLLLFDVDEFKSVNDKLGHLAGDRVLQGIASVTAKRVRRDELLARYGGDEFILVLPEISIDEASIFAERIRSEVETAAFDYDGESINVTISLGAASLQRSDVMQSLIARADEHLHEAKQQGRNRVVALA